LIMRIDLRDKVAAVAAAGPPKLPDGCLPKRLATHGLYYLPPQSDSGPRQTKTFAPTSPTRLFLLHRTASDRSAGAKASQHILGTSCALILVSSDDCSMFELTTTARWTRTPSSTITLNVVSRYLRLRRVPAQAQPVPGDSQLKLTGYTSVQTVAEDA
jgi:hypothetical protein